MLARRQHERCRYKWDFGTSPVGSSVIKLPQVRSRAKGGNVGSWPIAPLPQEYMSAMSRKLTRALHNAALMQRSMWRSRRIQRLRKFRQRLCCLAHTLDDELCGRA